MRCNNCGNKTSLIRYFDGKESCPRCGGFSEASGTKIDNLLARNSIRVRLEALKHELDTIPPHKYDKSKHDITINEDFIKKYPNRARESYTDKELKKLGYDPPKLKKPEQKVEFHGNEKKAIRKRIENK